MSLPPKQRPSDKTTRAKKKNDGRVPRETDPLVPTVLRSSQQQQQQQAGAIRARRSSRSPVPAANTTMAGLLSKGSHEGLKFGDDHDGYESIDEAQLQPRQQPLQQQELPPEDQQQHPSSYLYHPPNSSSTTSSSSSRPELPLQQQQQHSMMIRPAPTAESESGRSQPPLLEIPEEIYAVRTASLQVLKPLTKTWVCIHLCMDRFFRIERFSRHFSCFVGMGLLCCHAATTFRQSG
jgi:hypothetical protein